MCVFFFFGIQQGRGDDVMSVSELKGHIIKTPLGGESGPDVMVMEADEKRSIQSICTFIRH